MNTVSQSVLETGVVLNEKWEILKLIGRGGMGEVYKAHQLSLNRDAAIKVISQRWLKELSENTPAMEDCLERFRREVQIMAQVRHPNVLQIFDYGSISIKRGEEDASLEYIAMEFVSGGTLRPTMPAEGFYPDEEKMAEWLSTYFLPLLDGVDVLHEAGIIHRDLKPENVLLEGTIPKIADFGLARSLHLKQVTLSMDVKGTPAYMSPEHLVDLKRADRQTDVYSLGKILFEAAAGKISSETIPFRKAALNNPKSPYFQKLDRIIQDATAEARHERLPSVAALKRVIGELMGEDKRGLVTLKTGLAKSRVNRAMSALLSKSGLMGFMVVALSVLFSFGTISFLKERNDSPKTSVDIAHTKPLEERMAKTDGIDQALPEIEIGMEKINGSASLFSDGGNQGNEPVFSRDERLLVRSSSEAESPYLNATEHEAAASGSFPEKRIAPEPEGVAAIKEKEEHSVRPDRKSQKPSASKSPAKIVTQRKPVRAGQGTHPAKMQPEPAGAVPRNETRINPTRQEQHAPGSKVPGVRDRRPSGSQGGC